MLPRRSSRPSGPASSEWADETELSGPNFAYAAGRLILGQRIDETTGRPVLVGFGDAVRWQDDRHLVTIAGARSGKGLTCIRPNIATYAGSMFIIDPKGEHAQYEQETGYRRAMGQRVYTLDPFGVVGGASCFDPFAGLDQLDPFSVGDRLALLADALVMPQGDNPHWTNGARSFLKLCIRWMLATPAMGGATVARLRHVISGAEVALEADEEGHSLFTAALEQSATVGDDELGLLALQLGKNNEKELKYFASDLQQQLGFLAELVKVSARSDFVFEDLKRDKVTVFLVLPASKIGSHARWLRLLLMLAVASMEKGAAPPQDVVFLLEEFAALGHLETIEKAAGLMPGYGLKLWVILQDLPQLQKLYRDSWETFLDNAGAIQAFGNDGATTTEYFSRRIGQKVYETKTKSGVSSSTIERNAATMSERREWQPLIPPSEIGRTFRRDAKGLPLLLFRKGHTPAKIQRLPFDWVQK